MDKKLGKGLGALIPEKAGKVLFLKIDSIMPNRLQPRKRIDPDKLRELIDSIREKGIIQPVLVRPLGDEGYELIAGERRLRAVKELGHEEIPVIVRDVKDSDILQLAIIENIQREDLSPIEEANAYKELTERFNFSQDEISKAVGKNKATVSNTLRILLLPDFVQKFILDGVLSAGHAKTILSLPTEKMRVRLTKRIVKNNLSVRQSEELARGKVQGSPAKIKAKDENIAQIEEELQHFLGTRVKIAHGKKRGKITIAYFSNEDLNRILNLIRK
jgi:ParB family chromosome partitioning protein